MRRFVWVWLAGALALAGCDAGGQGNQLGVCSTVCRCAAGALPGQQRTCVTECLGDVDVARVPQACVECVFENADSCTDLTAVCFENNGPCEPEPPQPVPDTPPPF